MSRACSVEGCEKPRKCRGLCSTHYSRLWRQENPERIRELDRRSYWRHREKNVAEMRERWANQTPEQRETKRERANAWRAANLERARELSRRSYAKRKAEVPEMQRERVARWRAENLERARALHRQSQVRRRAKAPRIAGRPIDPDAQQWCVILRGDPCSYCGAPMTDIDHIEPLALDGADTWENLTAACDGCNSRKRHERVLSFLLRTRGMVS